MDQELSILSEIEAFLIDKAMTPTAFGRAAFGDPKFVFQLRDGRRVWPETARTARNYMQTYRPKPPRRQEAAA